MAWTQEEADRAFVEVRKRALTDKAFRNLVLTKPNEAIQKVVGKPVPQGIKIKVVEADPNATFTFLLPQMVSDELSSADLERVAGGVCGVDFGACAGKGCAAEASR